MATQSPAAMPRSKNPGGSPSLRNISKGGRRRPNRAVLYAVPGWGKSSIACHTPDPIVLMTRGEDGLRTLLANRLVPETPHFDDEAATWNEVLLGVQELIVGDHEFKTLVVDTLNGAAALCVDHVTRVTYGGDAAKFADYGRGWKVVPGEWQKLLDTLGRLNEKGVSILLLAHADVKTFKNPEGLDFDRYTPRMPPQQWEPVEAWADMVLFGQLETFVKTDNPKASKGKAFGGQDRLLYCERTAVADAKNRHGLPAVIHCGQGADKAWEALAGALTKAREQDPPAVTTQDEEAAK